MSTFDQLVAKYRNLSYGRLTANNPSALQNVIRTLPFTYYCL